MSLLLCLTIYIDIGQKELQVNQFSDFLRKVYSNEVGKSKQLMQWIFFCYSTSTIKSLHKSRMLGELKVKHIIWEIKQTLIHKIN